MNRTCVFKKLVASFFVSIFLAVIGLLLNFYGIMDYGIDIIFLSSLYFLFFIVFNINVNDLCLESRKLIFISTFNIQEIELETLYITSLFVTKRGPRFEVIIKGKKYYCFYTEDNYRVLKELVLINKVNTTLEELDRMVKYSVLPIKKTSNINK